MGKRGLVWFHRPDMFLGSSPDSSHLIRSRLNGTYRDKVADIDALEQAFMVMSHDQNCLDMVMVSEAKDTRWPMLRQQPNNCMWECAE